MLRWWEGRSVLPHPPSASDAASRREIADDPQSELVWVRSDDGPGMLPWVRFRLGGEYYNPREARERANRKRNPYLSPHAAFRAAGTPYSAILFLRNFGPLERDDGGPQEQGNGFFINLDKFFRRQRIYNAVTRLWDAYSDLDQLRFTWKQILANRPRPFSLRLKDDRWFWSEDDEEIWSEELETLWAPADEPLPSNWVISAPSKDLQALTLDLVASEVQKYTPDRVTWALWMDDEGRPEFRPKAPITSLWAIMWEFFALDTGQGIAWRICPHCGKVFYPPRRNRFFCTSRQQELHSKRAWWSKHGVNRAIQRAKRQRRKDGGKSR